MFQLHKAMRFCSPVMWVAMRYRAHTSEMVISSWLSVISFISSLLYTERRKKSILFPVPQPLTSRFRANCFLWIALNLYW